MYLDAIIQYKSNKIQLYINSAAVYFVLPKVRSRDAGHFYLSDELLNTTSIPTPKPNGPILTECQTLRNFMSSTAKVEVNPVHHDGKELIPIRTALEEMRYLQGPTPIKTENNTAGGFLNRTI